MAADHRRAVSATTLGTLICIETQDTDNSCAGTPRVRHHVRDIKMQHLKSSRGGRASVNQRLHEQRTALPEHVGVLRTAVVRFARARGATGPKCEHIALAVSEALSNSVLHAYVGLAPGPVTVEAWEQAGSLTVVVSDEGSGMVPRLDSPGLGIGLPLIAQMTERLDIEDRQGQPGVCLKMTFSLAR